MIFVAVIYLTAVAAVVGFACGAMWALQEQLRFRPIGYDPQPKYCPPIDSVSVDYRIIQGVTKGGDPYREATIDELTG